MSRPQIYRLAHSGISMVTGPGVDYGIMHVPNTYRAVTKSQLYHHPKTLLAQRSVSPRRRSSYENVAVSCRSPAPSGRLNLVPGFQTTWGSPENTTSNYCWKKILRPTLRLVFWLKTSVIIRVKV